MSSTSTHNRRRRASKIRVHGESAKHQCDHCFHHNIECWKLPGELKCADCTRRGRRCDHTHWEAFDNAYYVLSDEIAGYEKTRERLIVELIRIQAQIDQTRQLRVDAKMRSNDSTNCVLQERESGFEGSTTMENDVPYNQDPALPRLHTSSVWDDLQFYDSFDAGESLGNTTLPYDGSGFNNVGTSISSVVDW